ncbi:MAG TPA: amidohydrolase/deacetylase family metallohydrolase, partial [Candidatus Dormibacteraeota bacterium]|nr:amidohydrolase/deacetylase family metallohydrolase [Candidatus Dormibacteraeota bacterium]
MKRLAILLLFSSPLLAQQKYDLLIKNATVLDTKNNVHEVRDVAVHDHKIAAVEKNIPARDAAKTIDAKGLYLTP